MLNVDTTYFWRVAANDSTGYGSFSGVGNFTIDSYLAVSMLTDTVAFGSVTAGNNYSTVFGTPGPFRMENIGNIFFNVSLNASPFFEAVPMNSSYYMFRIRENSTETGALNLTLSYAYNNWSGMNYTSSLFHVAELNWRDAFDEYVTDINISVPTNESFGAKSSTVTYTVTGSGIG